MVEEALTTTWSASVSALMSRLTGKDGSVLGGSQLMTVTLKEEGGGRVIGTDVCACCTRLEQSVSKSNVSVFLLPSVNRLRGI